MKIENNKKDSILSRNYGTKKKPIALILAGYNKPSLRMRRMIDKEMLASYGKGELYTGQNKFLLPLAGKPVIQHVLDAVYGARKNGIRIYKEIYIYNDINSFSASIDLSKYKGVHLLQMTDSVAGHLKDFYCQIEYGQRVDIFFGDTPRITKDDVAYVNDEYSKYLFAQKGIIHKTLLLFGVADYTLMKKGNWLPRRIRYVKRGPNKGKLKSFVNFDTGPVRIGNCAACIKDPLLDPIVENEMIDFAYSMRKAMHPGTLSKILYYMWKTKNMDLVFQIKQRCINETNIIPSLLDIFSKLYRVDVRNCGVTFFHITKNAAHWENDIDGPADYRIMKKRYGL